MRQLIRRSRPAHPGSRRANFCTLPVEVFGSGPNSTASGHLKCAIWPRQKSIISGGENISSIEVEQTICAHPAVLEAAVVAIPHDRWGERPKAFVTLQTGADVSEQELIAFCRERMAHFKCPDAIAFGPLPKTSTGKVQKFALREPEWAGRERRIN